MKNHFCEFEVSEIKKISDDAQKPGQNSPVVSDIAEELIFCTICGETAGDVQ